MKALHACTEPEPAASWFGAATKPCDIKIEGADKVAKKLAGGLDGTYALWSCENGRPLYKREQSPAGRARPTWHPFFAAACTPTTHLGCASLCGCMHP
jgi:hypothetical protein